MIYDYLIIGGGPTGITLSWILSSYGHKVAIIDREDDIGGCHRVRRVKNKFTEHGPRVYSDCYLNFMNLLKNMNLNFSDYFIPYKFSIATVGGKSFTNMKFYELFWLGIEIFRLYFDPEYSKNISCYNFMKKKKFTDDSIDYIDRVCRLTDGAGAKRYTLFEFLQNFNQNIPYSLYQPRKPNDKGLLKDIKDKLKENNVDIFLDISVEKLVEKKDMITNIVCKKNNTMMNFSGKNFILAVPPVSLTKILSKSSENVRNSFGDFKKIKDWSYETNYNIYISVTYHWNRKLKLDDIWGFPISDWGIAFIVLSDYMKFNSDKTLITTCITKANTISKFTGKKAKESSRKEIKKEVFRQLMLSYPDLPKPDKIIISPGESIKNGVWTTKDNAFMLTPRIENIIDLKSNLYSNLYSVGTHSGYTKYHFTSMESAVTNGIKLAHLLVEKSKEKYPIKEPFSLINWLVKLITILLLIIFIIIFVNK